MAAPGAVAAHCIGIAGELGFRPDGMRTSPSHPGLPAKSNPYIAERV